jgi:2-polyprenyl-3-methyl-5-hydroxy-6-metoxy-1,4-benzoquinol methylase
MDTFYVADVGTAASVAPPTAFSCVVDDDPHLVAQCFIWLKCLLEIKQISPQHIFVHHTANTNSDLLNWVTAQQVNLVEIEPYDPRSPHCNKICQLETFSRHPFERIVLMDCDTAWIGDETLLWHSDAPIAAKITDEANPPEAVLTKIFEEAGLGEPDWVDVSFPVNAGPSRTDHNNCNGGFYALAGALTPTLDRVWRKWANWCLDRLDLFGNAAVHADQVSFALALRELGLKARHLPIEWNYPLHLTEVKLPDLAPQVIHFHRELGPDFQIPKVGVAKPDRAIDALNRHITDFLAKDFINSVFWDHRYKVSPEMGSGIGSRGDILAAKQQWLSYALGAFKHKQVIDIGCGDLEVMRSLPLTGYVGFDVSPQAIEIARAKRPDWQFQHTGANGSDWGQSDAVICLDVAIHQKHRSEFESLIRRLVDATRERLIISGYNEPPSVTSETVSYHRPLMDALKETGVFSEIGIIGKYRDCSLIVADKRRDVGVAYLNDMQPADYNEASSLSKRPDLLRILADTSRATFGFYTQQFSRALEYPWVAQKLEGLSAGQRVLDIGAGLNPLPLFLAERGAVVDCIDAHPLVRVPPALPVWNEWGFYDYGRHHPNLRAHQVDALMFEPTAPLNAVYSVSVIEHMPRATWEALLARSRRWLVQGGRLILTIDLIPGTQLLWNYSEGQEVEPTDVHGDVGAFAAELGRVGFAPIDAFIWQNVPKSRTDLLFLECVAV